MAGGAVRDDRRGDEGAGKMKRTSEPEAPPRARVRTTGLTKVYRRGGEAVHALAGVDLTISAGAFVAVMGRSGSGKSTLLNVLTGIDRPTAGEVWLDDLRLDRLSEARLATLRRQRVGLIFQAFNLLDSMSALENVMLPALLVGRPAREARRRASAVLAMLGLEGQRHRLPGQLSGGQQQRVAIARALVNGPDLLCADEPTGNLDAETGREVLRLLLDLHANGQTILLVTHDAQVAAQAQRVITMRDGRVVDDADLGARAPEPPGALADLSGLELD
jgi:putative ABC transport system ATP-binding protein